MKIRASLFILCAVSVAAGVFSACSGKGGDGSADIAFTTAEAKAGSVVQTVAATGTIEPEELVDIGAQVSGKILYFGKGLGGEELDYCSTVTNGMLLAKIDDVTYVADLNVARAQLKRAEASVARTVRWAERCRGEPRADGQQVFGIVQGGIYDDIRRRCAEELVKIGFDGYAVGGVSVGEPEEEMYRAVEASVPYLPKDRPRYVMGLGVMRQMAECVARGVDMFDCVIPTRIARHGTAITRSGNIAIKAAKYAFDQGPVEEGCECYCCRTFSRSYVRHLLACGEILGLRLLTIHNVWALNRFMADMRAAIAAGTFGEFRRELPPA